MDIIELAKEAGIEKLHIKREGQKHSILDLCYPELERFAAIVRAEAMKEAARACEERGFDPYTEQQCAALIRDLI